MKRGAGISWLFATLLVGSLATGAQADKVYLVGGSVIEGKATRSGNKIVVEVAAGTLTLEASSVARIEPGTTPLQWLSARRIALPRGAIAERLQLADDYREEGLRSAAFELLREVLALEPDNEQARQRLGFVRTEHGWVDGEQQLRAQGYVKRGEAWLSPAQAAELARTELARQTAELARQTAELERQKAEVELKARRAELARAEPHAHPPEPAPLTPWFFGYPARASSPPLVGGWQPNALLTPARASLAPFPINGVRDPRSYLTP